MSRAPGHSPGTGKNAWRRNLNAGGAFPPTGGDAADTRSNRGGGDMVSILAEGETCWRSAQADRMSVIIDAADFFRHAKQAMAKAKRSILLVGWDFDTRIRLDPANPARGKPDRLGRFLNALARKNPGIDIRILKWDVGLVSSRSEEHTSELQSLMRISYAVFCLKKKNNLQHIVYYHLIYL